MVCFSPVFFSGFICVRVFMSNSHIQYINELKIIVQINHHIGAH